MEKEIIYIDWNVKETDWVYEGFQLLLINDSKIYLKLIQFLSDGRYEKVFLAFNIHNKLERDILIQFGKCQVDERTFDLSDEPLFLAKQSKKYDFKKFVDFNKINRKICLEFNILDAETNTSIRELVFDVTVI